MKCPGDCNNAGICNTSTGKCTCDIGRHGQDCSSEYLIKRFVRKSNIIQYSIFLVNLFFLLLLEFDCPADGLCSDQGLCDDSIGNCICDAGFEGLTCEGNLLKAGNFSTMKNVYVCTYLKTDIFLDKSCPGGSPPCNGNGQCDHTNGLCTCNEGNQGSDCSGNSFNL